MKGKEYLRPVRATWWMQRRAYTLFMVRELTAAFVAGYAIFMLVLIYQAGRGVGNPFHNIYMAMLTPSSILLHLAALAMAIYHTITFFNLSPKVVAIWRGEKRLSPAAIIAPNYILWLVVSAVVIFLATRHG